MTEIEPVAVRKTMEEIVSGMTRLPVETALRTQGKGLRAAAKVVVDAAKGIVPQSTRDVSKRGRNVTGIDGLPTRNLYAPFNGALRESLGLKAFPTTFYDPGAGKRAKVPSGRYIAGTIARDDVFWGLFVEHGTEKMIGQPFLETAADRTHEKQLSAYTRAAQRGLRSVEQRLRNNKPTKAEMRAYGKDIRYTTKSLRAIERQQHRARIEKAEADRVAKYGRDADSNILSSLAASTPFRSTTRVNRFAN